MGRELLDVSVSLPKGLDSMDFDRKEVMKGLRKGGSLIRARAKKLISKKGRSKVGEYPARQTGAMRNAVKLVSSKRKDRMWVRVQANMPQDAHMFYPAVLNYGRKDNTLKPRLNAIADAGQQLDSQVRAIVDDAVYRAMKIWK